MFVRLMWEVFYAEVTNCKNSSNRAQDSLCHFTVTSQFYIIIIQNKNKKRKEHTNMKNYFDFTSTDKWGCASPRYTHGPIVRTGPTAGENRSRNQDGTWRRKRSDAGYSRY